MTKTKTPVNSIETQHRKLRIGRLVLPYAMVLPTVLLLAVFTFYPAVDMVYRSFFKVGKYGRGNVFCGLDNYHELFFVRHDFWQAVQNTLVYTGCIVVLLIALGLIFALWLQRSTFINGIVQRFMFLPHICAMLSVALIFQWLMDEQGIFNMVLSWFNVIGPDWLNDSSTAMIAIMIVTTWKGMGYYALILLSSVKSIPTELLEAADLDDAGKLRTFFRISLPMLSPQIFFLLITITINSFKVFDSVRIMTEGRCNTDVLVYYIYKVNLNPTDAGLAAAAGTFLLAILMVLTVVYFKVIGKRVHYQ